MKLHCLLVTGTLTSTLSTMASAFVLGNDSAKTNRPKRSKEFSLQLPPSLLSVASSSPSSMSTRSIVDRSTLTLLEHINLNVPNHDKILPFYFKLLQCGMDPRKASNLQPDAPKKTLWANMGASQFHLPYGDVAQAIPGIIGLEYNSLDGLKERLGQSWAKEVVQTWSLVSGQSESIYIEDKYGNKFLCKESPSDAENTSPTSTMKQPFIRPDEVEKWGDVSKEYGLQETDCRGLNFVEFVCPPGTAESIALFYDSVFDATTTCMPNPAVPEASIAIIAFGDIDESGRPEQSLIFREADRIEDIPPYDGHHIAMYVGETAEDYEQAFKNAKIADLVWVNPRFSDDTMDLGGARKWKQFRFKNIVDMNTGKTIMELEHEMRSIEHDSWPGKQS